MLLGLKLALRMVIKSTHNVFYRPCMLPKYPKVMFLALKLWMAGPQDSVFQLLHELEAGPEGGIEKNNNVFS